MDDKRVLPLLEGLLGSAVSLERSADRRSGDAKYWMRLKINGRNVRVQWLPTAWPKQVRAVLNQAETPDLIAAPELSPGARTVATSHGLGWLDETGAADFSIGPTIIVKRDSDRKRFDSNMGWRPATLAICETILTGTPATVAAVHRQTGLAVGTAATALNFLEKQRFLTSSAGRGRNSGREIAHHAQLLDAYSAAANRLRSPQAVRVGVLWRDPIEGAKLAGRLWIDAGVRWAATSALSAGMLAPFLTQIAPMEVYLDVTSTAQLRSAARVAQMTEASGGRLLLRPFPTPAGAHMSEQVQDGFWSMLWPRVFADLRESGVRGEDAADHLREVYERV